MVDSHSEFDNPVLTAQPGTPIDLVLLQALTGPVTWCDKRGKMHTAHSELGKLSIPRYAQLEIFQRRVSKKLQDGQYRPVIAILLSLVTRMQRDLMVLRAFGNGTPACNKNGMVSLSQAAVNSSFVWGNYRANNIKQVMRTELIAWLSGAGESIVQIEEAGTIDVTIKAERQRLLGSNSS